MWNPVCATHFLSHTRLWGPCTPTVTIATSYALVVMSWPISHCIKLAQTSSCIYLNTRPPTPLCTNTHTSSTVRSFFYFRIILWNPACGRQGFTISAYFCCPEKTLSTCPYVLGVPISASACSDTQCQQPAAPPHTQLTEGEHIRARTCLPAETQLNHS